jgi:hypothetical protein
MLGAKEKAVMPIDNRFYKIRGTELGEIQATLRTVAEGNMPSQEEADDVLAYVAQAFEQPLDED